MSDIAEKFNLWFYRLNQVLYCKVWVKILKLTSNQYW